MNCEKCQDRGFTEENHGLLMVLCDCEAGKKKREELGMSREETLSEVATEANAVANALMPKLEEKPKKGQYFCTKCGSCHFENKKTGQRHLKYKK